MNADKMATKEIIHRDGTKETIGGADVPEHEIDAQLAEHNREMKYRESQNPGDSKGRKFQLRDNPVKTDTSTFEIFEKHYFFASGGRLKVGGDPQNHGFRQISLCISQ